MTFSPGSNSRGLVNFISNFLLKYLDIRIFRIQNHPVMQLPLLSELTVSCDAVTEISPALEFDCLVEGKKLTARLTHQEDNGVQFIYRIYAKAICDDLNAICGFLPAKPPVCIRLKGEKEPFNVWAVPHVYKPLHYTVFYKGYYRFDLRKTTVWEAKSVRENSSINGEIASLVCRNIEKRLLQPQLWE
jgi:hypothetical protein